METVNYKKPLGLGFIALFAIFLINLSVGYIPIAIDSPFWAIRDWWNVISYILQAAATGYIAFCPQCKSSIFTKIGFGLYTILTLICAINDIAYMHTGAVLWNFDGLQYVLSLALYAPGLLFIAWGSKLWMPSKIALSAQVAIGVIGDMIWIKLRHMYQNYMDFPIEQIESIQSTADIIHHICLFIMIAALILTIIWVYTRDKAQYSHNNTFDVI